MISRRYRFDLFFVCIVQLVVGWGLYFQFGTLWPAALCVAFLTFMLSWVEDFRHTYPTLLPTTFMALDISACALAVTFADDRNSAHTIAAVLWGAVAIVFGFGAIYIAVISKPTDTVIDALARIVERALHINFHHS